MHTSIKGNMRIRKKKRKIKNRLMTGTAQHKSRQNRGGSSTRLTEITEPRAFSVDRTRLGLRFIFRRVRPLSRPIPGLPTIPPSNETLERLTILLPSRYMIVNTCFFIPKMHYLNQHEYGLEGKMERIFRIKWSCRNFIYLLFCTKWDFTYVKDAIFQETVDGLKQVELDTTLKCDLLVWLI